MLWRSIPQSVRAYIYFRVFFLLACSLFPFFSFFFFRWELFSLIWFTHKNTQKLSFLLSSFFFFDDAILAWNLAWLSNFLFFYDCVCVALSRFSASLHAHLSSMSLGYCVDYCFRLTVMYVCDCSAFSACLARVATSFFTFSFPFWLFWNVEERTGKWIEEQRKSKVHSRMRFLRRFFF